MQGTSYSPRDLPSRHRIRRPGCYHCRQAGGEAQVSVGDFRQQDRWRFRIGNVEDDIGRSGRVVVGTVAVGIEVDITSAKAHAGDNYGAPAIDMSVRQA